MSLNQTQLHDKLVAITQEINPSEFIYGFLDAYDFPASTLTQIRSGGTRNVAKIKGDVALKKHLYFQALPSTADIHAAAQVLKDSEIVRSQSIRFVIVTNFQELVAYDLKAGERMEASMQDFPRNYAFFLPLAGYEKSHSYSESVADVRAAEKMGRLFDLIRERNQATSADQVHALNVFLTRLLFCFFAEDTGIFSEKQFSAAIASNTREDGSDLSSFLGSLFAVLSEPAGSTSRAAMPLHLDAFPYVNGGLFGPGNAVPDFGPKSRRLLLECASLDWSEINPDIFGSMFQAVIDEEQRSNLGQHYTSVSNIMKVIKPLFLDKLQADLERARGSEKKLKTLLERLSRIKVFDPACGSGNFLIIAYKELRRFEMAVFHALNAIGKQSVMFMTGIKLTQFYGIEIDDFAHEIAVLSMWLAEHQMNKEFEATFGYAEPMLPLKSSGNIAHGNSLTLDWFRVCPKTEQDEVYVIGNPPFLGSAGRTDDQKSNMESVFSEFSKFGMLDFVACWFWKGAKYIKDSKAELAMVSTNSICQGEQVAMLWPEVFNLGVSIHFAYQSFVWENNARENAGVHVVVVGLSGHSDKKVLFKKIDGDWHAQVVPNISPYLFTGSNQVVMSRSAPFLGLIPKITKGSQPTDGGHLLLTRQERDSLITREPQAKKWIRKLLGAEEFINGKERFCLWLVDAPMKDMDTNSEIMKRVRLVRENRLKSPKVQTQQLANSAHLFGENRQPLSGSYILVPRVSSEQREYIPIGFLNASVISSDANFMIPGGTLYEFGILNSTMHNDWMRTVGGRLESRYRYSATLVYNTFPWPDVTPAQRKEIEVLAEDVAMIREDFPGKTLAFLYNRATMPDTLRFAHKMLDRAVERLYRARPFRDASERMEHLFDSYERLIAQERDSLFAQSATKKTRAAKT